MTKGGLLPVTRVPVRRRAGGTFTAYQLTEEAETHLLAGRRIVAYPGDWVVTLHDQVVEILAPAAFAEMYETVEEGLLLSGPVLHQLAQKLGPGSTASPSALLRAIDRLARIEIGTVKVDFTPGQLEEIAHRAKKRGLTPQQEVERTVTAMKESFFYGGSPMPSEPSAT